MCYLLWNTILQSHDMVDFKIQPIAWGTHSCQNVLPTLHVYIQTYLQLLISHIREQLSCRIHEPTYTLATRRTDANGIVNTDFKQLSIQGTVQGSHHTTCTCKIMELHKPDMADMLTSRHLMTISRIIHSVLSYLMTASKPWLNSNTFVKKSAMVTRFILPSVKYSHRLQKTSLQTFWFHDTDFFTA
jgi:hypothetical protein